MPRGAVSCDRSSSLRRDFVRVPVGSPARQVAHVAQRQHLQFLGQGKSARHGHPSLQALLSGSQAVDVGTARKRGDIESDLMIASIQLAVERGGHEPSERIEYLNHDRPVSIERELESGLMMSRIRVILRQRERVLCGWSGLSRAGEAFEDVQLIRHEDVWITERCLDLAPRTSDS